MTSLNELLETTGVETLSPSREDRMDGEDWIAAKDILRAAFSHDIPQLKRLLQGYSTEPANVQDPVTGYTPLHAAIAGCCHIDSSTLAETTMAIEALATSTSTCPPDRLEAATETLQLLLQNGAIWNELDRNDETPGCLARRLKLGDLYEVMVDAGECDRRSKGT